MERICPDCPKLTFTNLQEHSEHLATHTSTPAQWTEAHKRIQAGKERAKRQAKEGQ